jgi:hypothetical protein
MKRDSQRRALLSFFIMTATLFSVSPAMAATWMRCSGIQKEFVHSDVGSWSKEETFSEEIAIIKMADGHWSYANFLEWDCDQIPDRLSCRSVINGVKYHTNIDSYGKYNEHIEFPKSAEFQSFNLYKSGSCEVINRKKILN